MTKRDRNAKLLLAIIEGKMHGRDVAKAAGVSAQTMSAIINRRRDPKPETVRALCRVLRRTAAELDLEVSR